MMVTFCKLECHNYMYMHMPLCPPQKVLLYHRCIKNVLRVEKQNYNGQFFNNNFDHCEQEFSFLSLCMYNF